MPRQNIFRQYGPTKLGYRNKRPTRNQRSFKIKSLLLLLFNQNYLEFQELTENLSFEEMTELNDLNNEIFALQAAIAQKKQSLKEKNKK